MIVTIRLIYLQNTSILIKFGLIICASAARMGIGYIGSFKVFFAGTFHKESYIGLSRLRSQAKDLQLDSVWNSYRFMLTPLFLFSWSPWICPEMTFLICLVRLPGGVWASYLAWFSKRFISSIKPTLVLSNCLIRSYFMYILKYGISVKTLVI